MYFGYFSYCVRTSISASQRRSDLTGYLYVLFCSHLAVVLEMNSHPTFHRYFSESFIKNQISLLKTEYDRVTSGHAVDRIGITTLEVFDFGFCYDFSIIVIFCAQIFY